VARRALSIGDVVAAKPHRSGRQAHFADRLDQAAALAEGVLMPHARYVVIGMFWKTPNKNARRGFVVAMGDDDTVGARAWPDEIRLWNNRNERRWRENANTGA
jgi:hypothetical protein